MKISKLNYTSPETHEASRNAEMKVLSYEERIKRFLVLIEVSFKIINEAKSQFQKSS